MKKMMLRVTSGCFVGIVLMALVLAQPHVSRAQGYEQEIANLSAKMAESIAKSKKTRIAVVDFTDLHGNVTELGRFLAEEFSVALAGAGQGFEIMDRTHLQTILKQHKLAATGLIDPATAQQLGKIAGVDALITGTITPLGENVRLAIKILDAETAKVIGGNTGNIPATEAIQTLLKSGIQTGGTITTETTSTTSPTKSQQTVSMKGFTFSNPECKRAGENVTCSVLVTSIGQDKQLMLCVRPDYQGCDRTKIIDNLGNEYSAKFVQIGDKNDSNDLRNAFPADIPTKAFWGFEGVSAEATIVAVIVGGKLGDDFFYVKFPNVPLSK